MKDSREQKLSKKKFTCLNTCKILERRDSVYFWLKKKPSVLDTILNTQQAEGREMAWKRIISNNLFTKCDVNAN